jgi:hypothetical protein
MAFAAPPQHRSGIAFTRLNTDGPAAVAWEMPGWGGVAGIDSANQARGQIGAARAGARGQIGAARAGARGQAEAARYGARGQAEAARYGARGQAEAARAESLGQMGQARYGAIGQLGSAGLNSMGQYGSAVAGSLANQSIAAGNTFGQMANNYYNAMGQMGHVGGALSAAGLAASSNAANASMASNLGLNMGGGFGGGGGFGVSGPGGPVASGLMGGGQFVGGNLGGMGGQGMSVQRGGGADERRQMLGQGFDFLGGAMGQLNSPNNQAMALAGLAGEQFNQNRNATINPMFMDSMNTMFNSGVGPLMSPPDVAASRMDFGPVKRTPRRSAYFQTKY